MRYEEQALKFLREISSEIFEEQLNGWYRVASVWSSERDLTTFRMWFEIGFHTTIVDLCDDRNTMRYEGHKASAFPRNCAQFEYLDVTCCFIRPLSDRSYDCTHIWVGSYDTSHRPLRQLCPRRSI